MIKNIVTISLIIFIIAVISILGAGVFIKQNKTDPIIQNSQTVSPITEVNDDLNNDDDDGDRLVNNTPVVNTPVNNIPSPATGLTTIQVTQHNKSNDCWMIVNNKVYNLTSYMSAHPGGAQTIIPFCGKDGTTAFATKGGQGSHSQEANNLLINYYVGNLIK